MKGWDDDDDAPNTTVTINHPTSTAPLFHHHLLHTYHSTPWQATDFLRPPELAIMQRLLNRVADLKIVESGGFPQAERKRLFFFRDLEYAEPDFNGVDASFQALNVEGNFIFDKVSKWWCLMVVLVVVVEVVMVMITP